MPRQVPTWVEHADINDVMLATSLEPDGFLALGAPDALPAQGDRRYAADDTP